MYRLIAVDMDGTLLNSEHQVTERNKQAIIDVINAGKLFVISTGRPPHGVKFVMDMIDADLPFIMYNGALVMTSKSKQILHESVLAGELARQVVQFGIDNGTTIFVYARGSLHVTESNPYVKDYMALIGITPIFVDDLAELAAQGVTKVLFRDTPERIAELQNGIRPFCEGKLNYYTSQPTLLEFVDINTSKGAAMKKIGEHYNIAQSDMMAIGDSFNDVAMLKYAAFGVAMGNAPQEVKDAADAVTLTNDEDGVAEAIYRYMLNTYPD